MAASYRIDRQEPTTVLLPGGIPTQGQRIWFTVYDTQTTDYIDIPNDQYDPKSVKNKIQAKVDAILELFSEE